MLRRRFERCREFVAEPLERFREGTAVADFHEVNDVAADILAEAAVEKSAFFGYGNGLGTVSVGVAACERAMHFAAHDAVAHPFRDGGYPEARLDGVYVFTVFGRFYISRYGCA